MMNICIHALENSSLSHLYLEGYGSFVVREEQEGLRAYHELETF